MSERKVLQKYYPPDFDPSAITRVRGPKSAGPKVQPVRLMAPFSMKCTSCGEYIYKGRKFNARKETTPEKYYAIPIHRFYIRCTRCSGEITFRTDPKNMDYECERGARRNTEPWRDRAAAHESDEQRLDRLEREEADADEADADRREGRDAMAQLEGKVADARTEMKIADALDEIRTRNARNERVAKEGGELRGVEARQSEAERRREMEEREDEEAARRAFAGRAGQMEEIELDEEIVEEEEEESVDDEARGRRGGGTEAVEGGAKDDGGLDGAAASIGRAEEGGGGSNGAAAQPAAPAAGVASSAPPSFKKGVKRKKDFTAALGIKKKVAS